MSGDVVRWGVLSTAKIGVDKVDPGHGRGRAVRGRRDRLA